MAIIKYTCNSILSGVIASRDTSSGGMMQTLEANNRTYMGQISLYSLSFNSNIGTVSDHNGMEIPSSQNAGKTWSCHPDFSIVKDLRFKTTTLNSTLRMGQFPSPQLGAKTQHDAPEPLTFDSSVKPYVERRQIFDSIPAPSSLVPLTISFSQ